MKKGFGVKRDFFDGTSPKQWCVCFCSDKNKSSLEQAEEKLRKGGFLSHNPYDKDVAATAQILSVEIEYLTQEYQAYLQPFYKFIITDKSWDISDVMTYENWEEYTSVSEVYVPAIQDKYLDIKENALLRTN